MTPLFGQTRTCVKARHALITPDGHVASALPGLEGVRLVTHITPAMGAAFAQFRLAFTEANDVARFPANLQQTVIYVTSGVVRVQAGSVIGKLEAGGFAYISQADALEIFSTGVAAQVTLFQKKYVPSSGLKPPASFLGSSAKITGQPFLGNPKALLQVLLPDEPAFDLAVNVFTYQPGATLPFVETHIMEHGLLMLSGQGVYRLEDSYYPVTAGDVIWMAPYCPQWFVAMGDEPASYLYYKDVNRAPLP
jgi:(S)-ureidoglycine aminohydrolase